MTDMEAEILRPLLNEGVKISQEPDSFTTIGHLATEDFEQDYLAIRKKENRLLPDQEVLQLPALPKGHQYHKEWALRQNSLNRFLKYLIKQNVTAPILDIGCGNGWFTAILHQVTRQQVIGVDINQEELRQASRLFQDKRLIFCHADILKPHFRDAQFSMITLNAASQYFPSLPALLQRLGKLLVPDGEIHLIDSPFYKESAAIDARERSAQYYSSLGHESFASQYFARSWEELEGFHYEVKYRPGFLGKKLGRSPFPWVLIHSSNEDLSHA